MQAFIFDTETTGLIPNLSLKDEHLPEMTEFYGSTVDLDSGEVVSDYGTLVKPKRSISDEIVAITGIDNDLVRDAPPFAKVADAIQGAILSAPMVIAHNLSFDTDMVALEFARIGKELRWPDLMVCTVEQTVHRKGYRLNLGDLHAELFGEPHEGAHRAKPDVDALVKVCVQLRKEGYL